MIALTAALLLTASGPGQPPRPPVAPAQRRVCRVQETLGSITPRRTCHTVAEWAQIDTAMERARARSTTGGNSGAPGAMGSVGGRPPEGN